MEEEIPQSLIDELTKGRATLFLGAGASKEAGFPDSQEIASFLTEKAGGKLAWLLKGKSLDSVAAYLYLERGYGPSWVRQKIIDLFEQYHRNCKRPPSSAHELITKLKWSTIFTTNFDRLVEISYESSPECVQRYLPIFTPDPQNEIRDPDVVRVIKLNGSVDEAARNGSHKLVLTFKDQQDSLSYNNRFYNIFRQEAINGPIIFIGFSFTHPGARAGGTSPEFQLLQGLIREIGPTARDHFCISKFDQSNIDDVILRKTLEDSKIIVINSTFGAFIEALFKRLKAPPIALEKRKPVSINVANRKMIIKPEDYSKDKQHFEIINLQLTEEPAPSINKSLNGYENWSSFFNGHCIERLCKPDFLKLLKKTFEVNKTSMVSFVASPGWGKTFFARDIAVELSKERPVIWLNPYSSLEFRGEGASPILVGTWDLFRIDALVGMVNDKAKEEKLIEKNSIPVLIADNCAERVEEVLSLYRTLAGNNRSFLLLMTFRDNEYNSLIKQNPLLKSSGLFKPEGKYDTKLEVRNLVDFCERNQVALIKDITQKEVVVQQIIDSKADAALIFALQIIFDRQHRPFADIMRGIWNDLATEQEKSVVLRVASFHRFGSTFYPRFYSLLNTYPSYFQIEMLSAYKSCIQKGILFEETDNNEPCVRTLHTLVAEKLTEVSGVPKAQLDDEVILLSSRLTNGNPHDLELTRKVLKKINDYRISLSSEEKTTELFQKAVNATNEDWVVCQQFSKYLLRRNEFDNSITWINRALEQNPSSNSLQHQKGNILRHWGMNLKENQKDEEANIKFAEAKRFFTKSRMGSIPNEYGFVTHLDMLRYLWNNSIDENEKANLIAEGVNLYSMGVKAIPQYAYNVLLEPRFRMFDLKGTAVNELSEKIKKGIKNGTTNTHAISFLADNIYKTGQYTMAINLLQEQRRRFDESVLLWVKEAEIDAKEGRFSDASKCLDSAKMREDNAENAEVAYKLAYWDLITSFVLENFKEARIASGKLMTLSPQFRQRLPQGYIWKMEAKNIEPAKRQFTLHARIWTGRIESLQVGGQYGRIELSNAVGDTFNVDFVPKYFSRRILHQNEYVKFIIAIYPFGLRAVSEETRIFENTPDDVFVKE